jgi:hypothetical protein
MLFQISITQRIHQTEHGVEMGVPIVVWQPGMAIPMGHLTFNSLIFTLISNVVPVGDFILLTKGRTSIMWRLLRTRHVCMYSILYSIFDSVWSSYQFPCPSHCPMHNLVPVLFPSRAASTFHFALQVPLFKCHCPSYIPHSQGGAVGGTFKFL